ncbi:uracil phosphoribosyltransferase [Setaria viridis]
MSRNEETLLPSIYLNKLPAKFPDGCHIFLMDPMLATGGTMAAAVNLIEDHGANIEQITVISAITCPPAIENLRQLFPVPRDLRVCRCG